MTSSRRPPRPDRVGRVFGPDDELGTVNFLTSERVAAPPASSGPVGDSDSTIRSPRSSRTRPGPGAPLEHHVFSNNEWHRDDWLDSFYLQSSSQIDALRHIGHPRHGFYNGLTPEANDAPSTRLGVHNWADAGIAGRGVLLDVPRFFERTGRAYDPSRRSRSTPRCWTPSPSARASTWRGGDILLLRTAWAEQYLAKSPDARLEQPLAPIARTGAARGDPALAVGPRDRPRRRRQPRRRGRSGAWSRDFRCRTSGRPSAGSTTAACCTDRSSRCSGMALGELWKLDELAADCAADGVYDFFLTCKPLNIPGGVGSPPNAIAIK